MPRGTSPLLRPPGLLAVALALSLGWGIRGNYGHEIGAMVPGALAAITAAIASRREDWRARVPFFALFGALGWAFGGSMSYMQVIGYTHSGDLASQAYGFAALFLLGFLWAALGGGATALVAEIDRERLERLFPALLVALVALAGADSLRGAVDQAATVSGAMRRQDGPLYWLDADWLDALAVVVAMLGWDLLARRGSGWRGLVVAAAAGACLGAAVAWIARMLVGPETIAELLVRPQGDTALFPREALVTNWPNALPAVADHLGWALGMAGGIGLHFARHGRFADGAGLCLRLALGWLGGFLLLPVLLGARLTPPRGDDWAGILGVTVAALAWCRGARLPGTAAALVVAGTIGGLAFAGGVLVKLLLVAWGNPALVADPEALAAWAHWQGANWHSFLEQLYGLANGVGIAVALGLLDTRLGRADAQPRRRWTEAICVLLVVPWLLHANLVDNVADWTTPHEGHRALPLSMRAPLAGTLELSALGWFELFFGITAAAFAFLVWIQSRRPLAIVPPTWLGRGQLLLMLILWPMTLGNFAKALPGFAEGRLLTEGTILVAAVAVTLLVLLERPADPRFPPGDVEERRRRLKRLGRRAAVWLVVAALAAPVVGTAVVRGVYGGAAAGHAGTNLRFGPDANWRTRPILRGTPHR